MTIGSLTKFWPLIHATIREFWSITEPEIENAAVRNDVPFELYLYSELGLERFSVRDFQQRDPFSNPEQFERLFVRLNIKGWIEPMLDGSYRVTEKAREMARYLIEAGDVQLADFSSMPDEDLKRLVILLKQIVNECCSAPEPPEKWAILKRFRVADEHYPPIMQIREYLMDLFAYRDDSHLSASRPYFNDAGIVWIVLGLLWRGLAANVEQIAEKMEFRGYEVEDYDIAVQAAVELGWAEQANTLDTFRLTAAGTQLREQAEKLTNEYFYAPWAVLTQVETDELYDLLLRLREGLSVHRKPL